MSSVPTSTPAERPARIFGVCAAIGEDFGINTDWLRIAFATSLLFALETVLIAYAALGVVVLASRLLSPNRRPAPPAVGETPDEVDEAPEPWRLAA